MKKLMITVSIFLMLLLINIVKPDDVYASDCSQKYPGLYIESLAAMRDLVASNGFSDTDKYYMLVKSVEPYSDKNIVSKWLYISHSDDSHAYFTVEGLTYYLHYNNYIQSSENIDGSSTTFYTTFSHYDSINSFASSHVGIEQTQVIYSNVPVLASKDDEQKFLAGEEYETRDYINTAEESYDPDIPVVENVFVSYKKEYLHNLPELYLNFDFPEASDKYQAEVFVQMSSNIWVAPVFGLSVDRNYTQTKYWYESGIHSFENVGYQPSHIKLTFNDDNWSVLQDDILYQDKGSISSGDGSSGGHFTATAYKQYGDTVTYSALNPTVVFYVRLVNGNSTGDFVKCTYDCSNKVGASVTVVPVGGDFSENSGSGTSERVDGSNGLTDIDNAEIKDTYDYGSTTTDFNIKNLVKDLFGIIGDNGFVQMISQIFTFIPPEIFYLLNTTFGIICAIVILKFLRG